jgi:hypothetical protein
MPGYAFKIGAIILKDDEDVKQLLQNAESVRVHVREGKYYDEKFSERFRELQQKYNVDGLHKVEIVQENEQQIIVKIKDHRGRIKQIIVMIDEPGSFVLVNIRGKDFVPPMISPGRICSSQA